MIKIILNLKNEDSSTTLAARAARHMIDHPEKEDALLEYGGVLRFYGIRNKKSISIWEQ